MSPCTSKRTGDTHFTHSDIIWLFVHICISCRFPQEEEQLQHWISSMRTAADGWRPSVSAFLCSDHFTSDCFHIPGYLHSYAVPSVFHSTVGLHLILYFKKMFWGFFFLPPDRDMFTNEINYMHRFIIFIILYLLCSNIGWLM